MALRKTPFAESEFYHIYNRGVEKRAIVSDTYDADRFLLSLKEFNVCEPIGSIYERTFARRKGKNLQHSPKTDSQLVRLVAYCLNPNHYHLLIEQKAEQGIEQFMQRLGTGYTKYFNHKYKRSGSLFQGVFKSAHVSSNEYLLHVSAYINLNNRVHQFGSEASKLVRSSWKEYTNPEVGGFCQTGIVLDQFSSRRAYERFARSSLHDMIKRKEEEKEIERLLLE